MELWIRSQDEYLLTKTNRIYVSGNMICCDCNGKIKLGTYKTEERALEVLNDIQKTMHLKDMYINDRQEVLKAWTKFTEEQIGDIRTKMSVYEMPKE